MTKRPPPFTQPTGPLNLNSYLVNYNELTEWEDTIFGNGVFAQLRQLLDEEDEQQPQSESGKRLWKARLVPRDLFGNNFVMMVDRDERSRPSPTDDDEDMDHSLAKTMKHRGHHPGRCR